MGCYSSDEKLNGALDSAKIGDHVGVQEAMADELILLTPGTPVLGIEYRPASDDTSAKFAHVRIRVLNGPNYSAACWLPSATAFFKT
jgi:hypothetical protein